MSGNKRTLANLNSAETIAKKQKNEITVMKNVVEKLEKELKEALDNKKRDDRSYERKSANQKAEIEELQRQLRLKDAIIENRDETINQLEREKTRAQSLKKNAIDQEMAARNAAKETEANLRTQVEENKRLIAKIELLAKEKGAQRTEIQPLAAANQDLRAENTQVIQSNEIIKKCLEEEIERLITVNRRLDSDRQDLVSRNTGLLYQNKNLFTFNQELNKANEELTAANVQGMNAYEQLPRELREQIARIFFRSNNDAERVEEIEEDDQEDFNAVDDEELNVEYEEYDADYFI